MLNPFAQLLPIQRTENLFIGQFAYLESSNIGDVVRAKLTETVNLIASLLNYGAFLQLINNNLFQNYRVKLVFGS